MKIKTLQFYDYRVFYSEKEEDKPEYFIEIDGKNLLLYGENGSGKTSLFKGLRDIIYQNDFTPHFQTPLLNAGYVELAFDDNTTDKFDATGANASKAELLGISKLNSFLSYKELLRTHLDYDDYDEINFFDLIVNSILNEHNLQTLGKLKTAWTNVSSRNLAQERVTIQASVGTDLTQEEATEEIDRLEPDYQTQIIQFNDEFNVLLADINAEINSIVSFFNQGITVEFILTPLTLANISNPELKANVIYAQINRPDFHRFLNEAKLSAIAISIYLSALNSNPTQGTIKFLFLDDIFLGLDLSNRLPLLDVLKDKFSDWQIFLTTYDRHWFEVAKQYLNNDWKSVEMYATEIEGKIFDKPLIIQSQYYFDKAINYFNVGDYPASLNYLRKELEFQIKDRLPEESTRHYEGKPHQLSHLWELLVERYSRNNQGNLITEKIKSEFQVSRLSLLNPQSHDNLSSPVYKYELQRTIDLIKDIQAIPVIKGITLLASGMELVFKHPAKNYSLTLELLQDWKIDIVGPAKTHDYPSCRIKHWQMNKNDYYDLHRSRAGTKPQNDIEERFDRMRTNILGYALLQPLTEKQFNSNTKFENLWSVKELLDRCDNQKRNNWFFRIFRK